MVWGDTLCLIRSSFRMQVEGGQAEKYLFIQQRGGKPKADTGIRTKPRRENPSCDLIFSFENQCLYRIVRTQKSHLLKPCSTGGEIGFLMQFPRVSVNQNIPSPQRNTQYGWFSCITTTESDERNIAFDFPIHVAFFAAKIVNHIGKEIDQTQDTSEMPSDINRSKCRRQIYLENRGAILESHLVLSHLERLCPRLLVKQYISL